MSVYCELVGAEDPSMPEFERAQAAQRRVELNVEEASTALKRFDALRAGPLGLIPDEVKRTAEYRSAKQRYDAAFGRLREFNAVFVKKFAKELAAARRAKRA